VVGALNVLGLLSVLGLLDVLGLNVLGLLVFGLPRPVGLPSPVEPVDRLEPRWRIGPLRPFRPFEFLDPLGLPMPDGLPTEFAVVNPVDGVGFVNIGVAVGLRELAADDGPVDRGETDEPDEAGAQLTPGVIVDDGAVALGDLLAPVPVVPAGPVDCANAGAVLKAIAQARPAPLRMGIFRMLINMLLLPVSLAVDLPVCSAIDAIDASLHP
jgi:hypothetical protein